jgi:NADH-quinone oxidoreductase subunit G
VSTAAIDMVTLTIDDVQVSVPKGTGLVEAAAIAGIEIPVFCYEPRLGPPVGACRMCLCEVAPGPPKPQAACTLTAAEGMVVKTAATSEIAAESQNATLEFILVNHPLDCPVCDKGGECPLQDLTFRYGPGSTRMTFAKRTFDKPIPISPTIALDRERCILCYRCTRFSEAVSEDGQLVARNRGASSLIATFEDRPYRAPFSGNVIELCPVGALTSTPYRFEGRPWEIQSVPSVCGLCPVGCNVSATVREGKVKRILSRNHPEIDEGWLCDKGRFAFPALRAEDRVAEPLSRTGGRRFAEASWDKALDELERLARAAGSRVVVAFSGDETVEVAYSLSRLVREGFGAHTAVLPEETSRALDAHRRPLSALRDAQAIVVLGDHAVVERAPVVDLWIRAARRHGARIVTVGPTGQISTAPGAYDGVASQIAEAVEGLDRIALVWTGAAVAGAELAAALGERVVGVYYLPAAPNGRAVAEAWDAAGAGEAKKLDRVGLLVVCGDEAARSPRIAALAVKADAVVGIGMFAEELRGIADLVLPATSYLERDGTMVNLEGRVQRLRRAVIPPCPDELAWIAKLAERFGVKLPHDATGVFAELSPKLFGGVALGDLGEQAPLPAAVERPETTAPARAKTAAPKVVGGGPLRLARYRALFSGPTVERVTELSFQRPEPVVELSTDDASVRGIENGDAVRVSSNGISVELRARVNRRLIRGAVRAAAEHVEPLEAGVEVTKL